MGAESCYIGQQINNYHILEVINSGAYGTVYKAKHLVFDDEPAVAMKIMHISLTPSQEQQLFLQEARLLRKLKHSSILPILDAGVHQGIPYLVTIYASRGSLRDRLRLQLGRPLPLQEALTVVWQIGQALHFYFNG